MKKFTKEQLAFFIISVIAVLLMTYKAVGFDLITGLGAQDMKYQTSVDSIITLESKLSVIQNSKLSFKRDLFNFINAKKVVVQQADPVISGVPKTATPKRNTIWHLMIEPISDLELIITGEGKAKINAGGSMRQISVGDQVPCATGVDVEVDVDTGEKTGRTRKTDTKMGTVVSIDKRNVYFSISGSSQGIKLNSREGAKVVDSDFIPKEDKGSTPTDGEPENPTKVKRPR